MKTKVITIANQKGGVAKTTTAQAFALGLKEHGNKVLVIDLDPQGNLSHATGADLTLENSYEVFAGTTTISEVIQKTEQFDIVACSKDLFGADQQFIKPGRENILKKSLAEVKKDYDYIVIDTSPTLGLLVTNALTASDELIVPVGAEIFSYQGLASLVETYKDVKENCNPDLVLNGLLATRYNPRTNLSQEVFETFGEIAKEIGTKLYKTTIREGIAIREAQASQESILGNSKPADDYRNFVKEYLGKEI